MLLQFAPSQPHYLLDLGDGVLTAGETFEGPKSLLESDDIIAAPGSKENPIKVEIEKPEAEKTESSHSPDGHSVTTRPATPPSED